MKLQCEHREIERVLLGLRTEIDRYDAYIHPSVIINEKKMDLHVTADKPLSPEEVLFKIPACCLPDIDKFRLAIEDDALCIHGAADGVPTSQKRIYELIIELYNLSNKIREYKKTSPWFSIASYPELLQYLIQGRAGNQKIISYHELWEQGDSNRLIQYGFLGRRCFGGLNSQAYGYDDYVNVLHPFIDLLNHHSLAPGYQVSDNGTKNTPVEQVLYVFNSQPISGVNECLVRYSLFDPFDALLIYGFVDTSSRICRSVPVEIILANGLVINIESRMTATQRELPPDLKDLYPYMPKIWQPDHKQNRVCLSHVIIPGFAAPEALRRVLAYLIEISCQNLSMSLSGTLLMDLVMEAEAGIVAENLKYYRILLTMCSKIEGQVKTSDNNFYNMMKEMAQLQIDLLHNYKLGKEHP